ncbi:hypothetical protein ACI2KR_27310 [Pseudomonas luteola]
MTEFHHASIPLQNNCRWFVRRGEAVQYDRGFRSKGEASDWIESFGSKLDWRAGFSFKLKGDNTHMEIVNRQGALAKP